MGRVDRQVNSKMHDFLQRNKNLFWHFNKEKLDDLSNDIIVEYILNYGDEKSVKELFGILGVKNVATIFYKNTQEGRRTNYLPVVKNYFTLYFKRNAQ